MALAALLASSSVALAVPTSGILGPAPNGYPHSECLHRFLGSMLAGLVVLAGVPLVVALFARGFRRTLRRRTLSARAIKLMLLAVGVCALVLVRPFLILAALYVWWLLIPAVVAAAAYVWWGGRRRGTWERLKRLRWAALLLLPLFLAFGVVVFYSSTSVSTGSQLRDPRARLLLPASRLGTLSWLISLGRHPECGGIFCLDAPRLIFPSADRQAIYVGFGFLDSAWPSPVIKLNRATGAAEHVIWMYSPWRGACPAGSGRCFVTSHQTHHVLVVDDQANRVIEEIRLGPFAPSFLTEDEERGVVYFPSEFLPGIETSPLIQQLPWAPKVTEVAAGRPDAARAGMVLLKVDARQSRLEAFFYSRSVPFHTNVGTTACDPAGDRVAIGQGVPAKHILFAEGGAKTPVVKELGWFDFVNTLGIPMGVAFDRERNLIYISWPLGGVLYAFDATSFEPKYWRLLEMGVRDIQFDAGRDLLYVAGYRTGRILIFDVASRRVVDHLYVGQKIRDLRFCPDLDVLLVAYVGGFVEIPLGFLPPKMPRR